MKNVLQDKKLLGRSLLILWLLNGVAAIPETVGSAGVGFLVLGLVMAFLASAAALDLIGQSRRPNYLKSDLDRGIGIVFFIGMGAGFVVLPLGEMVNAKLASLSLITMALAWGCLIPVMAVRVAKHSDIEEESVNPDWHWFPKAWLSAGILIYLFGVFSACAGQGCQPIVGAAQEGYEEGQNVVRKQPAKKPAVSEVALVKECIFEFSDTSGFYSGALKGYGEIPKELQEEQQKLLDRTKRLEKYGVSPKTRELFCQSAKDALARINRLPAVVKLNQCIEFAKTTTAFDRALSTLFLRKELTARERKDAQRAMIMALASINAGERGATDRLLEELAKTGVANPGKKLDAQWSKERATIEKDWEDSRDPQVRKAKSQEGGQTIFQSLGTSVVSCMPAEHIHPEYPAYMKCRAKVSSLKGYERCAPLLPAEIRAEQARFPDCVRQGKSLEECMAQFLQ